MSRQEEVAQEVILILRQADDVDAVVVPGRQVLLLPRRRDDADFDFDVVCNSFRLFHSSFDCGIFFVLFVAVFRNGVHPAVVVVCAAVYHHSGADVLLWIHLNVVHAVTIVVLAVTVVVLAVTVVVEPAVLAVTVVVEAVVHAVVVVQPIFLAVAVVVVKTDVVRDYCPYLARLAEAEVVVSVVVAAEILTS